MAKATRAAVRTWMLTLMARQAPQTEQDVKANIALSLPSLQLKFPAEAFCQGSIDAIASTERFWNEAGVTKALEAWWRLNDTSPVYALPAEAEMAPVSSTAKNWLAGFYRANDDEHAARELNLIRGHSDEAYAYLVQHDDRAASIAVWQRWAVPYAPGDLATDWDDEQGIRERVRKLASLSREPGPASMVWKIAANMLVQAVRQHAPQHRDALVDELKALRDGRAAERSVPVPISHGLFGDV